MTDLDELNKLEDLSIKISDLINLYGTLASRMTHLVNTDVISVQKKLVNFRAIPSPRVVLTPKTASCILLSSIKFDK